MKKINFLSLVTLAVVLMGALTSQVNTYINGNILTASQLNSEFGNIYSTVNNLDDANLSATAAINPAKIAGTIGGLGLVQQIDGSLDVVPDGTTLELNADQVRIKSAGVASAQLAVPVAVSSLGTVGAPVYSFSADPDTGIYSPGTNQLSLVVGGASSFTLNNHQIKADDLGSAGTPIYTFSADPDTGIYSPGANQLGFSVGGSSSFILNNHQISADSSGSASAPIYTFTGDTNTGIYRAGTDAVAVAAGGTEIVEIDPNGIQIGAGGGFFKVKVVSLGNDSSVTSTKTAASGLTSPTILAILPSITSTASAAIYTGTTTTYSVAATYDITFDTVTVDWSSMPATSKAIRATIIYQ